MKILILGPLKRKIAPEVTAARPRLIFDLATGLIKKGHQVTILGTGNSQVKGTKIISVIPSSIIEMPASENPFVSRVAFLTKQAKILEKIGDKFDVIHNHARPEFFNLFAAERIKTPMLTTMHGVMEKENDEVFSLFKKLNLVCISKAAARLAKKTKVHKVIYNGIDTNFYRLQPKKQNYLLWLGRLSKAKDAKGNFMDPKGICWAIKLARTTGSKLLLAGNVEDIKFFNKDVKPYLNSKIKWIGPVAPEQLLTKKHVAKLMAQAKVFLMTINWQEPFGLVMAEAMSCGTPVIGFKRGSVPEVIKQNKTGFVVEPRDGVDGLKKALAKIDQIKPIDCRKHVEKNFSLETMVSNYEQAYKKLCLAK